MSQEINITQLIFDTINSLFSTLFNSINNNIYSTLDSLVFINPNILQNECIKKLLDFSSDYNLILIANALLLGVLIFYGFKLLFSHLFYIETEKPFSFIIKLLIFGICINYSYFICENIISLNSNINLAINFIAEKVTKNEISFNHLISQINNTISLDTSSFNLFSFDGIIEGYISIGFVNLLFTFAFRYILIEIFILLSPFAILSLTSSSFSTFFKIWIKNFISLLLIQNFISLIITLIFSINVDSNKLFIKLIYVSSIYALLQSNKILHQLIGGLSYNISSQFHKFKK